MNRSKSAGLELPQPAPRERKARCHVVGLPPILGGRDLDPHRGAVGAALELGQEWRVVGLPDGGIAGGVREVAHRRRPLPVEQRQREERQRHRPATGEAERQHRTAEQRAEPGRVRPDRRVHERERQAQAPRRGPRRRAASAPRREAGPARPRPATAPGGTPWRRTESSQRWETRGPAPRWAPESRPRARSRPAGGRSAPPQRRRARGRGPPQGLRRRSAHREPRRASSRSRWRARMAPSPTATPRANVSCPAISRLPVATANHTIASHAWEPNRCAASPPNSPAAATAEIAPTSRGPIAAPSGGNRRL